MPTPDQSNPSSKTFPCGRCGDPVTAGDVFPACNFCGTWHRKNPRWGVHEVFARSDQITEATTLLLGITGLAIVCYDDGLGFGWALLFCAFALLYWKSLQSGVVSSRFFFFRFPWTVTREESPTAYWIGMAIEGLIVLGVFIIMLITL